MFVPFPHVFEVGSARHIPDARNALIQTARYNGVDYIMQIDADQQFPPDFFLKLWGGIKEYGDESIITGWAICKSGMYGGQPSVIRFGKHESVPFTTQELCSEEGYQEVDAFGSCGFLAATSVFDKIDPPWFADVNIIHPGWKVGEFHIGTEHTLGQDISFGSRAKEAGIKMYVCNEMRMPHKTVTWI
jgi:hypothetical protein